MSTYRTHRIAFDAIRPGMFVSWGCLHTAHEVAAITAYGLVVSHLGYFIDRTGDDGGTGDFEVGRGHAFYLVEGLRETPEPEEDVTELDGQSTPCDTCVFRDNAPEEGPCGDCVSWSEHVDARQPGIEFPETLDELEALQEETVVKPSHYTKWLIEPVTFIMRNGFEFWRGNIVKYASRAGSKLYEGMDEVQSEITDLKKTIRYAEMRINQLNGEAEL